MAFGIVRLVDRAFRGWAGRRLGSRATPLILIAVTVLVALHATGTHLHDILAFGAYEGLAVLLPGWLVALALMKRPGSHLRQFLFAWCFGSILEIAAFNLTAALDVRWGMPIVIAVVALGVLVPAGTRGRLREQANRLPGSLTSRCGPAEWALAAAAVAMVIFLWTGYYDRAPLPQDAASVSYFQDIPFQQSLAADALHNWPIGRPDIAGESIRYHLLFHMSMAASHQVSGVDLSVINMRLFPLLPLLAMIAGVSVLAEEGFRRRVIGAVAALLVVVVGEPDLDPNRDLLLGSEFQTDLWLSPTLLFSFPMLLGALTVALPAWRRPVPESIGAPGLLMLGLLSFASTGAKGSTGIVLVAGAGLMGLHSLLRRRLSRPEVLTIGAIGGGFLLAYVALFAGGTGGDEGLQRGYFEFTPRTILAPLIHDGPLSGPVSQTVLGIAVLIAVFVPVAGLPILWRLRRPWGPATRLITIFVALSIIPMVCLGHQGSSQRFFVWPGLLLGSIGSAAGLVYAWEAISAESKVWLRRLGVAIFGVGMIAVMVLFTPEAAGVERVRHITFWVVTGAVLGGMLIGLLARSRRLTTAALGAALGLIGVGAFDAPVDRFSDVISAERLAVTISSPSTNLSYGLTPGMYGGLTWVRENTPADSEIAVNNHYSNDSMTTSAYYYYTAFSERRAYLESWDYTAKGFDPSRAGDPYPERREINDAAFTDSTPANLERLREQGVDYMVLDKRFGVPAPELEDALGPAEYVNDEVAIYKLGYG